MDVKVKNTELVATSETKTLPIQKLCVLDVVCDQVAMCGNINKCLLKIGREERIIKQKFVRSNFVILKI